MKNSIVKELIAQKTTPCVSLFISTGQKSFTDKIDSESILSNLRKELRLNFDEKIFDALYAKITQQIESLNHHLLQHGVGIFVNPDYAGIYYFSSPVRTRTVINGSFEIRDVVADLNKKTAYYVLLLNKEVARLFKGYGVELAELKDDDFPFAYNDVYQPEHHESGIVFRSRETKANITKLEGYLRQVDHAAAKHARGMLLVISGVDRLTGIYSQVSRHQPLIVDGTGGSFDQISLYELSHQVWPAVVRYQQQEELKSVEHAREMIGMKKGVSGIQEVWTVAKNGNGKELFVEESYCCKGYIPNGNSTPQLLLSHPGDDNYTEVADAVDELMEVLLNSHGTQVHVVEDGTLEKEGRILLTTRY